MKIAEAIGSALAKLEVRDAFGLLGSGNFLVTQAMVDRGVRFVAARHESAAVSMADGYARVSGRPGVVTVHQGPGLTNAMTALTEAAKARTPLLVLAADTSAGASRSNFAVDQAGLATAVGAVAERARSPETALEDLARAWRTAVVERRAVLFSMPLDVQAGVASGDEIEAPEAPEPAAPAHEDVERVADLLAAAASPVLVGGRGAVLAGAGPAIEALGNRVG
ncbi:MAG TPA: thiamine pyrophosphate-binding protein, partial [Actinomycetota bacterium]